MMLLGFEAVCAAVFMACLAGCAAYGWRATAPYVVKWLCLTAPLWLYTAWVYVGIWAMDYCGFDYTHSPWR